MSSSITISPDTLPAAQIQALFYHLSGKTERLTELFFGAYDVDRNSFGNLHHSLAQQVEVLGSVAGTSKITVFYAKDEKIVYQDFSKFLKFEISKIKPVSSILYEYDFSIENKGVPEGQVGRIQNYKFRIRANQFDKDDREIPAIFRPMFERPISLDIDYVDYSVARSLVAVAKDWVDSLHEREKGKILSFLYKHDSAISLLYSKSIALVPLIVLTYYFYQNQFSPLIRRDLMYVMLALTLAIGSYSLGQWMMGKLSEVVHVLQPRTFLNFCEGDNKMRTRHEKEEKKSRTVLAWLVVGFLGTFLINLMYSYIYKYLE